MKVFTQPQPWQITGILAVGILAISTSAMFVRLAVETTQDNSIAFSLVIAASRLSIAAMLLSPGWKTFQALQIRSIWFSVAAGLLLAIHFAAWISSLAYTSITASTTLVTTNPIWVALGSWIWFKEPLSRKTALGVAIALAGGILIGSTGQSEIASNPLLGNGLALVGAWAMSLYLLVSRESQRAGLSTANHILIAYSIAAVVLLPIPLLVGGSYMGYSAVTYLWLCLMALIPQLIGHTSFNWAVKHISPTLVALAILMEPIGASILGYLIFHELPSSQTLVGAIILLFGVAVSMVNIADSDQR